MNIGKTIAHYTILEKLGSGGMGVVYKARDTRLDRIVALKFLPPHLNTNEEQKSRFIREAKASSAIDHPNVGSVFEIGETDDGQIYICMAYYEGDTLKAKIDQGALALDLAVDYSAQIARGLAKAHENGIIHRDLKPANVIVTMDGIAKVIDFGLAKLSGAISLTRTGMTIGTVAYMSPEQARGENIGAATDIWSMGVMMYEMIAGRLPFTGEFEASILYSIVNEAPSPLASLRPDVPMELVLIIEKALDKDPLRRHGSMDELATALSDLQKRMSIGTLPESGFQLISGYLRSILRRNRRTVVIGTITIGLVICGYTLFRIISPPVPAKMNRTIAVLPFRNQSDSSNNYFSAGFKEDISGSLSRLPGTLVISSKSTTPSGLREQNDSAIAAEFGVRFLLKGDITVSVATVRLSAVLYDAENNKNIWREIFTSPRTDVLTIVPRVVEGVAGHLRTDYTSATVSPYIPKADVYDAYLHGVYHSEQRTQDSYRLARAYYLDAIQKDSMYTPVCLSLVSIDIEEYWRGSSDKMLDEAEYYCTKVLSRDSVNAQACALEGMIKDARGKRDEALTLFQRSLALDPNDLIALTGLGSMYLTELNEPAKSIVYLKHAQELNPTYWMLHANLGVGYAQTKNYPEAKRAFLRALQLDPSQELTLSGLGYTCERLGAFDSASYYYRTGLERDPKSVMLYTNLTSVLLAARKTTEAETLVTKALHLLPGEQELYYDLGLVLLMEGKRAMSEKYFKDGLNICLSMIRQEQNSAMNITYEGLFCARLGRTAIAHEAAIRAAALDSTNEEIAIRCSRIFAIIGQKAKMLASFQRARTMNPEYDVAYLMTALDFEKYRQDTDLLTIARQN